MPLAEPPNAIPDPSEAVFESWLGPKEAFAHLPDGPGQPLVNRLLTQLADGVIRAAGRAIWWEDGLRNVRERMAIQPRWWLNAQTAQNYMSTLWTDGEETFLILDQSGMENIQVNFYHVRFDTQNICAAVPGLWERHPAIPRLDGGYLVSGHPLFDRAQAKRLAESKPGPVAAALAAAGVGSSATTVEKLSAFGERVEREREVEELRAQVADLEAQLAKALAKKHRGGAPEKPFWEPLWIEMARQIWEGDLKPLKQAEIARAMLAWTAEKGYSLSDKGARIRAQMLLDAIKNAAGNN